MTRTQEQIREEIEAERERLARAVAELRTEANITEKLKPRLPLVAAGAASIAFLRLVARRRRNRS